MISKEVFMDIIALYRNGCSVRKIASAILDRLLHHSRVINIKGHSYRLKEHTFSKQLHPKQGEDMVTTSPP